MSTENQKDTSSESKYNFLSPQNSDNTNLYAGERWTGRSKFPVKIDQKKIGLLLEVRPNCKIS